MPQTRSKMVKIQFEIHYASSISALPQACRACHTYFRSQGTRRDGLCQGIRPGRRVRFHINHPPRSSHSVFPPYVRRVSCPSPSHSFRCLLYCFGPNRWYIITLLPPSPPSCAADGVAAAQNPLLGMVDQLIDGRSARMGQMGPRGADPRQRDAIAQAMFGPRGPPPGAMMGPRGPEMMGGGGVGDQFVRDFEVRGVGETEECKERRGEAAGVRLLSLRYTVQ